tara:strand:- start:6146 stop:12469 length:6324 start_codon:yes stop_codon:yes gene_type:complete
MDTQLKRYARKLVEEQLGQSRLQLAQIADDISFIKTQQEDKFSNPDGFAAKPYLTRFKIMICGVHPPDADPRSLPWAYPAFSTSGLRGESLGIPILPRGTFVYVSRETQTGEYFIERIAPNMTPDLPLAAAGPYSATSGLDPTNTAYPASDTVVNAENSRELGNEIFNFSGPSYADYLQNTPREEAKWQFPTLDGTKNTVGGMSAAIENSIKDVERLKKNLIGNNSILRQSLETLDHAEKSVEAISATLKKQVKLISGYLNTVMKKAQKKVLRMINQMMNKITAAGPLSGKFASNELINKAIKVSSCAFNLAISEMPNMVGQGLMGIVNKAVNTTSCLIENFVSNFVGQIVGQLSALVEGAIGTISNVLGGATDVLGSIGDVLSSIMNILNCEVTPKAGDPVVKEWNLLDGGSPVKITLNTDNIFEKAKKVGQTFKDATKVPTNIGDYKYKFDPSQIAEETMKQCGDMGPDQCGPPAVTFWGGEGKGATGNAVVSTAATNFGQLMGVEIREPGNYTEPPFVNVSDECGGGRGAVLQAILGPVEVDPPVQDFVGNVETGSNTVENFNFEPLIGGLEPLDLIGMEVRPETDILPEGTVITDIKGDILILSNDFTDTGAITNANFRIVGPTPPPSAGITTFDVSVKYNRRDNEIINSKYMIDNMVQRNLCSDGYTLERGRTYVFDQSSPSNGLILKVGTDEFQLRGETEEIDTFWYDDVRIHPLRFSTKSDGIHNCDVDTLIDDPEEWPLSKDRLPENEWVLTEVEQGWSPFLQTYGRYPKREDANPNERDVVHEGIWEVDIEEPGTYTFEMQADNEGTITFDGIYLGKTDPIPTVEIESTVPTESRNSTHNINYVGLHPEGLLRVTDKYLEFDDNPLNGFDRNASLTITGGDASFSEDGRQITGTGPVKLRYEWLDNPRRSGKSLDSFTIEDIEWTQTNTISGVDEKTVNLVDVVTITDVKTYSQEIDLRNGPHRVSKFLEVEVIKTGRHDILATIQNTTTQKNGVNLPDWSADNVNPAALAWVLRKGFAPPKGSPPSGEIIRTSNDPFKITTETVISNCGEEYTDGVTKEGEAGKPNAKVIIDVQPDAPDTLYYYCENHPKMGGKICIIDQIELEDMSCRNAQIEVTAINSDNGSVIATRLLNPGTGYLQGTTNLLTKGGNGTSLTFDITGSTTEGNITGVSVRNGGKGYAVNDVITPICNFGGKVIPKTGIGVTAVIVKETGWGYKPWPNGDLGGMNRTWADRCQTIVYRANGDWDIPYSYGQVATLYIGDCITLPAQSQVCIDQNFTEDMIPGSTIVREQILPQDMTDIEWGGLFGDGTEVGFVDPGTRAFEDAVPDANNPYYVKDVTYVERIDGTDPDYPAGTAQWWFYFDGEYKGTFIQDTLSDIPQIIEPREGKSDLIYRVADYRDDVMIQVTIDYDEWYHVAPELRRQDPEAWVINDPQGWSPFLQSYGVFPSITDELGNTPQIGTWSVLIEETGDYFFEVQADNQGSITFDGTFLGSTTVFKSHNDSTFFEVYIEVDTDDQGNPIPTTKTIEGTILNAFQPDGRRGWDNNPAALAWVLRKGNKPDRQMITEISTVLRESRDQTHSIVFQGLKQPGDVRWATNTLLEFDDDSSNGFDINAKLEILSGEAVFVENADGTCGTIRGTGDITIKYSWTDNPRISGQVLDFLTIEDKTWDQGDSYSGFVTETVTLVDSVTTEEVEVTSQSFITVGGEGEIIASSLNPFQNDEEIVASNTKTLFGINKFTSKDTSGTDPEEPVFTCDRDYIYARNLGFSDCDIRNFLVTSGMAVDQCMQDKLDDEDWGICGDMRVLVTAPDCPEKGGECPPGYYFDNGVCRPDPCPPGEHWDPRQQTCVPDEEDECPPGQRKVNGICVDIWEWEPIGITTGTTPGTPGTTPGTPGTTPGTPGTPGTTPGTPGTPPGPPGTPPGPPGTPPGRPTVISPPPCPPGQHKENGICVPDACPPGYMKDPAGSGKCIPIVPTTCPPSDTYRVIASLESIIVANPGFGYNCCDDTVVIEPANGAEAVIEECDGGILSIRVTKGGAGFTELPEVYINTKNGLNAFLLPVLKFHRENFDEFPEGTSVLQVIDCVGNSGPNARTRVT